MFTIMREFSLYFIVYFINFLTSNMLKAQVSLNNWSNFSVDNYPNVDLELLFLIFSFLSVFSYFKVRFGKHSNELSSCGTEKQFPSGICFFKGNNEKTRTMCIVCSKLTIKILENQ